MPMFRILRRSNAVFPLVIVATIVVACLSPAALHWTVDASALMRVPIRPLTVATNQAASWLRHTGSQATYDFAEAELDSQVFATLSAERSRFERLYRAQRLQNEILQDQLSHLQGLDPDQLASGATPTLLSVPMTGRSPGQRGEIYQVPLTNDARERVMVGSVALFGSKYLLGRVTALAGTDALVLPIASKTSGPLKAAVISESSTDQIVRFLAKPLGNGSFLANVPQSHGLVIGSEVVLADPAWPASAQGMVIGLVIDSQQDQKAALRQQITIRSSYQLGGVGEVVLLGEAPAGGRQ